MIVLQTYELVLQLSDLGREWFQKVREHCDDFQLSISIIRKSNTIDGIVSSPDSKVQVVVVVSMMIKTMIMMMKIYYDFDNDEQLSNIVCYQYLICFNREVLY